MDNCTASPTKRSSSSVLVRLLVFIFFFFFLPMQEASPIAILHRVRWSARAPAVDGLEALLRSRHDVQMEQLDDRRDERTLCEGVDNGPRVIGRSDRPGLPWIPQVNGLAADVVAQKA